MGDFRSFKTAKRLAAKAMEPVVDPAGWDARTLTDVSAWSYAITERDADELAQGVAAVRKRGVAMVDVTQEDFPLAAFGEFSPTCGANCWTDAASS